MGKKSKMVPPPPYYERVESGRKILIFPIEYLLPATIVEKTNWEPSNSSVMDQKHNDYFLQYAQRKLRLKKISF